MVCSPADRGRPPSPEPELGATAAAEASSSEPPRRILFVGNSLTYCNDLDTHVQALAQAANPSAVIIVDRAVKGGAPLKTLWKKTDARKMISSGIFDAVVLQEDLPETSVDSFKEYARRFHEHVTICGGASPVFLMTWPYDRLGWITTEGIAKAHSEIALEVKARVAPAALAWQRAAAERPDIRLYSKDMEHPSVAGTYLAACVVFATLWRRSPEGLQREGQPALGKEKVKFLQRTAWEAVQAYAHAHLPPQAGLPTQGAASGAPGDARAALVAEVFEALDVGGDGALSAAELRRFEDFVGFTGSESAWAEEFALLAGEVGCDPSAGISLEGFRQLTDAGTERGVFSTHCTDEELQELRQELADGVPTAMSVAPPLQVVIVPGNGGGSVWHANWYGWLATELQRRGVAVALRDMPDPVVARESVWLPFIADQLAGGADNLARTVVVGHSSGAAAAMRLAEGQRLAGIVLVAAYTSDLGDRTERKSGYFARPWEWAKQRDNCGFVVQFASTDDPFLPINEQRKVRDGLSPLIEYLEFDGRSHFFDAPFWELLEVVLTKLGLNNGK